MFFEQCVPQTLDTVSGLRQNQTPGSGVQVVAHDPNYMWQSKGIRGKGQESSLGAHSGTEGVQKVVYEQHARRRRVPLPIDCQPPLSLGGVGAAPPLWPHQQHLLGPHRHCRRRCQTLRLLQIGLPAAAAITTIGSTKQPWTTR